MGVSPPLPLLFSAQLTLAADLSYATPISRTTPLLVAVKSGRVDVVRLLLDSGARVSVKDALGHSALFYASRAGNAKLVEVLLGRKPPLNDGSLHEACRGFHVRAIQLLLQAGHDANFRSLKHGGRTALGEIALRATPPVDVAAAEETLELLAASEASPLLKVDGKTVIFLALDNEHNEAITKLLLERMLYRTLNSHENTYQHGSLHYSPTMYVAKGILLGPPSEALLQLLKAHGCEDRFYATMGQKQPPDVVGLPEQIQDFERERQAREHQKRLAEVERANAMRREREKTAALARSEANKHHRAAQQLSQQQRPHHGLDHHRRQHHHHHYHYQGQDLQTMAEKHGTAASVKGQSSVRWPKPADKPAMRAQKSEADLARRKQLEHQHEMLRQFHVRMPGAWETHEPKVPELRSHQGNGIGEINLEELRRWQKSEGRMKMGAPQYNTVSGRRLVV